PTKRAHRRLPQQPQESQAAAARLATSVSNCSMQSIAIFQNGKPFVPVPRMLGAISAPSNIVLTAPTVGTSVTPAAVAKHSAPTASLVCGVQRCNATPIQILQPHQCTGLIQTPQLQVASDLGISQQVAQPHSCPQHGHQHQARHQSASPVVPALASVQTVTAPCCHHHAVAATSAAQVVQLVQPPHSHHPTNSSTSGQNQHQHQHQTSQLMIHIGQAGTVPVMATSQPQQHACQTTAFSSSSKTPITPQTPGSTQPCSCTSDGSGLVELDSNASQKKAK
ncbi:hypothetical protein BIW11_05354, partial [Tropilaelaps mercedesae]